MSRSQVQRRVPGSVSDTLWQRHLTSCNKMKTELTLFNDVEVVKSDCSVIRRKWVNRVTRSFFQGAFHQMEGKKLSESWKGAQVKRECFVGGRNVSILMRMTQQRRCCRFRREENCRSMTLNKESTRSSTQKRS